MGCAAKKDLIQIFSDHQSLKSADVWVWHLTGTLHLVQQRSMEKHQIFHLQREQLFTMINWLIFLSVHSNIRVIYLIELKNDCSEQLARLCIDLDTVSIWQSGKGYVMYLPVVRDTLHYISYQGHYYISHACIQKANKKGIGSQSRTEKNICRI